MVILFTLVVITFPLILFSSIEFCTTFNFLNPTFVNISNSFSKGNSSFGSTWIGFGSSSPGEGFDSSSPLPSVVSASAWSDGASLSSNFDYLPI